jgi:DNA-damage-inducible protein J
MVGGLPFELRQPRYNAETEAALQETRDMMAGKINGRTYSSFGEYLEDMGKEKEKLILTASRTGSHSDLF